jgi:hypothetical protein
MRGLTDNRLQEVDRVLRHQIERDWSLDIGGVAVAALVGREDVEALCQRGEVVLEEASVGKSAVQ